MRGILQKFAFCQVNLSPPDWPVHVHAVMADGETRRSVPGFPGAATVQSGRMGHGRGFTSKASQRAALGEMIEIASCCEWGDENPVSAIASDLGEEVWSAAQLNGFSALQTAERNAWNDRLIGLDWVPVAIAPETPVDWLAGWSLISGRRVWIPADFVLIGRAVRDSQCCVADSSGCACGETIEVAQRSALYELIERDATGRWWYGGRVRPRLDATALEHGPAILRAINATGRELRLFDITSDLAVPTVAAIAANANDAFVSAGFATRASLHEAAQSALCELMQMELRFTLAQQHRQAMDSLSQWAALSLAEMAPFACSSAMTPIADGNCAADDVAVGLERLAQHGIDVAFIDMTRAGFGVPVVRLVSPQLCHWKPRLGKERLLAPDPADISRVFREQPNPAMLMV